MKVIRFVSGLIELAVFLAILLGLVAGALGVYYIMPGKLAETKTAVIVRGAGLMGIAEQLSYEQIISNKWVFAAGVVVTGQKAALKAGEYEFPPQASMLQVAAIIASGKSVVHKITVVEGETVKDVFAKLAAEPALTGDTGALPPEGTLLPETYFFNRGDARADLVKRMQDAGAKALADAWANRAPDLPLKSAQEALVLASIIEKETGVAAERARVGGVFINRLRQGMRLQSDPTVIYPLSNGTGELGREISRNDLANNNPYNTYVIDGLPPAPIANPGLEAIRAATQPEPNEYLYFVADGTGGHAFAKSLDEHNRNVTRWRQLRRVDQNQ